MRTYFGSAAVIFVLCGAWLSAEEPKQSATTNATVAPEAGSQFDSVRGLYIGPFNGGRITVSIQDVNGDALAGYSIYKANIRQFKGNVTRQNEKLAIVLNEPGDDPDDGVFTLTLDGDHLSGVWSPNDKRVRAVNVALERTEFRYNPTAGKYPETSTKLLKTKDVENLKSDVLRIMRNEIYARHGYCFQLQDMRDYFFAQPWYVPTFPDVRAKLTKIEARNDALIRKYEDYGADYYDRFGR